MTCNKETWDRTQRKSHKYKLAEKEIDSKEFKKRKSKNQDEN